LLDVLEMSSEEIRGAIRASKLTIAVYGLGWMGLPTACLFAEAGARVIGVDVNPRVIRLIKEGKSPIEGRALESLLRKHVSNKRFTIASDSRQAASQSDVMIIIVPTSVDEGEKPVYASIERVCKDIGLNMKRRCLIIVESTVGPGVTENVAKRILEAHSGFEAGSDFALAYSPIRAMAGNALKDIQSYPRIIGGIDGRSLRVASAVLSSIVRGGIVKVRDIKTAEAVKLFENVYRDVNIALSSELAILCEKIGIDFKEAREAANTQPHSHIHTPRVGVGGHCIPVNPYFLIAEAKAVDTNLRLVKSARRINDRMPTHIVRLVSLGLRRCKKTLKRSTIAVLGSSYRADVKDARHSPSHEIIERLLRKGAKVRVYDPYFTASEIKDMGYLAFGSLGRTIEGVDCILLAVGHDEFKKLKIEDVARVVKRPACIVDGWRIFNPEEVERNRLAYYGVGFGRFSAD
jgi:UDP-N-acetyl-D-mannosaminuronic acid dehydrogenase